MNNYKYNIFSYWINEIVYDNTIDIENYGCITINDITSLQNNFNNELPLILNFYNKIDDLNFFNDNIIDNYINLSSTKLEDIKNKFIIKSNIDNNKNDNILNNNNKLKKIEILKNNSNFIVNNKIDLDKKLLLVRNYNLNISYNQILNDYNINIVSNTQRNMISVINKKNDILNSFKNGCQLIYNLNDSNVDEDYQLLKKAIFYKNNKWIPFRLKPLWLLGLEEHPGIYDLEITIDNFENYILPFNKNIKNIKIYNNLIKPIILKKDNFTQTLKNIDVSIPFFIIAITYNEKIDKIDKIDKISIEIPFDKNNLTGNLNNDLIDINYEWIKKDAKDYKQDKNIIKNNLMITDFQTIFQTIIKQKYNYYDIYITNLLQDNIILFNIYQDMYAYYIKNYDYIYKNLNDFNNKILIKFIDFIEDFNINNNDNIKQQKNINNNDNIKQQKNIYYNKIIYYEQLLKNNENKLKNDTYKNKLKKYYIKYHNINNRYPLIIKNYKDYYNFLKDYIINIYKNIDNYNSVYNYHENYILLNFFNKDNNNLKYEIIKYIYNNISNDITIINNNNIIDQVNEIKKYNDMIINREFTNDLIKFLNFHDIDINNKNNIYIGDIITFINFPGHSAIVYRISKLENNFIYHILHINNDNIFTSEIKLNDIKYNFDVYITRYNKKKYYNTYIGYIFIICYIITNNISKIKSHIIFNNKNMLSVLTDNCFTKINIEKSYYYAEKLLILLNNIIDDKETDIKLNVVCSIFIAYIINLALHLTYYRLNIDDNDKFLFDPNFCTPYNLYSKKIDIFDIYKTKIYYYE